MYQEGNLIIDSDSNGGLQTQQHQQQLMVLESSGEEQETKHVPRKRAETWVKEETLCLISFRRELDELFNTSKTNRHLWEIISAKMRENGFERSSSMCLDKWRNLLKDFKKAKHDDRVSKIWGKMWYYDKLQEFSKERKKNARQRSDLPPLIDSFVQFSDRDSGGSTCNLERGLDHDGHPLGTNDAVAITADDSGRSTLNLRRGLDHDEEPIDIYDVEAVTVNRVPPLASGRTPGSGGGRESYRGRVITIQWGDCIKRIGIDGSSEAIKETIRSTFGLRTRRAFWLEDEYEIVRSIGRDMPLGNYTLHLDKGLTIKICLYDDCNHVPIRAEERTFYCEEHFYDFLSRVRWVGLKDLSCYRNVERFEDLHPGELYQGLRL